MKESKTPSIDRIERSDAMRYKAINADGARFYADRKHDDKQQDTDLRPRYLYVCKYYDQIRLVVSTARSF